MTAITFLSASPKIELPDQQEVDDFLGPPAINWHIALNPLRPMGVDPLTGGAGGAGPRNFVRYRKGQCRGMQNALRVIREVHAAWGERFGRYHAPLVEEYRLNDADYALVTIGSMTGAAKDAIDLARSEGEAVGLIKIKTFRPFPLQAMAAALAKVQRIGVVDRSVSSAGIAARSIRTYWQRCIAPANPFRPSVSSAVLPAPTSPSSISLALSP